MNSELQCRTPVLPSRAAVWANSPDKMRRHFAPTQEQPSVLRWNIQEHTTMPHRDHDRGNCAVVAPRSDSSRSAGRVKASFAGAHRCAALTRRRAPESPAIAGATPGLGQHGDGQAQTRSAVPCGLPRCADGGESSLLRTTESVPARAWVRRLLGPPGACTGQLLADQFCPMPDPFRRPGKACDQINGISFRSPRHLACISEIRTQKSNSSLTSR